MVLIDERPVSLDGSHQSSCNSFVIVTTEFVFRISFLVVESNATTSKGKPTNNDFERSYYT